MSDYLWDKTGEPEEDVAQLEHVLGALKYRPRPLDIPATAAMPAATAAAAAATAARPATTIFSRPRLALAASLLLTLLAGAWLVTRQGEPPADGFAKVEEGSAVRGDNQTKPHDVPNDAARENAKDDALAGNVELPKPPGDRTVVVAAVNGPVARRPSRQPAAKRQKLPPHGVEHTPAPREEVVFVNGGMGWQAEQPLTPRQREATEQLMLALRLASAKLNYAQREVQEIGRAGK